MTTFKCADVKQGHFTFEDKPLAKVAKEFAQERNIDYETGNSNYPLVDLSTWYKHGLVATVVEAYNKHIALELSPDDLWCLIIQGVATHLSDEEAAEKHRKTFVNHSGKKKLMVDGGKYNIKPKGICEPNHNQKGWVGFVEEIAELINHNTKCDIADMMTKSFSTTGPMESQVFRCCLMEAMQNYFEYVCYLACGIPEICLLGTLDDYKNIKERVDRLSELLPDLDWWFIKVHKIIDNFVSSIEGKPDIDWWNRIVTKKPVGSGGQTTLSGWLGDMFPYSTDFEGKLVRNDKSPNYDKIGPGLTFTPVTLDDQLYTGKEYKLRLAAGFLGAGENKETQRLRPVQGWMMFYEA
ncbi:hypothetical protein CHS0354_040174 [Potamilus streckersoni]|uniref:Uncharacterized protein n=1 Tax=Potamilus streckersoni TaxID=2493646 RepID=A0AAE0W0G0_9BIVA|nr:hypothetical protein CHS0354_040174 [Potamilus streckersoni]